MMIAFTTVTAELAGQHIGRYVQFAHGDGWDEWVVRGWLHKVELPTAPSEYVYLSVSGNEVEPDISGLGAYAFWPSEVIELTFPTPPAPAAADEDE